MAYPPIIPRLHTYGPTCLLHTDSNASIRRASETSEEPPKLITQFFYAAEASIDEPIRRLPFPPLKEGDRTEPLPFSAVDNAALEDVWLRTQKIARGHAPVSSMKLAEEALKTQDKVQGDNPPAPKFRKSSRQVPKEKRLANRLNDATTDVGLAVDTTVYCQDGDEDVREALARILTGESKQVLTKEDFQDLDYDGSLQAASPRPLETPRGLVHEDLQASLCDYPVHISAGPSRLHAPARPRTPPALLQQSKSVSIAREDDKVALDEERKSRNLFRKREDPKKGYKSKSKSRSKSPKREKSRKAEQQISPEEQLALKRSREQDVINGKARVMNDAARVNCHIMNDHFARKGRRDGVSDSDESTEVLPALKAVRELAPNTSKGVGFKGSDDTKSSNGFAHVPVGVSRLHQVDFPELKVSNI
jgi:hypothetical protein